MSNLVYRRVLFIAWDGPYVNYMEGLFVPIFEGLIREHGMEFHVLHFSWGAPDKALYLKAFCEARGVFYTSAEVKVKPHPVIGKYLTMRAGAKKIRDYVTANRIEVVMPRNFVPADMVLKGCKGLDVKLVYDADGLPIDERVDFAGLKPGSFRYRSFKNIEGTMLRKADRVMVRSSRAIKVLAEQHGLGDVAKFYRVTNGRDEALFKRNMTPVQRAAFRQELGIPPGALLLVYCGSLGPQYGIEEMFYIFHALLKALRDVYFLLVTGNPELVPVSYMTSRVIVRKAAAAEVPRYLSIADIGFAIRKPTFSMQGVFPVKLGEYLLMGLPVIATAGIGDTEDFLAGEPVALVLKGHGHDELDRAVAWIQQMGEHTGDLQESTRALGLKYFGLKETVRRYYEVLKSLVAISTAGH
jgi:glycosyltransferase involved in cell wall biosynthesis